MEKWHIIDEFPDYYVSNYGKVKSLKNGEKFLKPIKDGLPKKQKYLYVNLYSKNKVKKIAIHRLVAKYFVPNPNKYPYVNHKDECGTNNKYTNLEWCTCEYNNKYGTAIKRKIRSWNKRVKPVIQMLNGVVVNKYDSASAARKALGIKHPGSVTLITKACKGIFKKAYGFEWKYEER